MKNILNYNEDELTYNNISSCLKPKSGTFDKLK